MATTATVTPEKNEKDSSTKDDTVVDAQQLDDKNDKEGLLLHYDVIVSGTSLVASILACACSRAGKTVLHTDAADYYGGLDAVWTFEYLKSNAFQQKQAAAEADSDQAKDKDDINNNVSSNDHDTARVIPVSRQGDMESFRMHSMKDKQDSYRILQMDSLVSTPYGVGKVVSMPSASRPVLSLELVDWTLTNQSHPLVHVGLPNELQLAQQNLVLEDYLWQTHKMETVSSQRARLVLQQRSRSLALDVSPTCLLAAGPAVSGLLQSGVSDYLEFKPIEGLLYLSKTSPKQKDKHDALLQRVPCHKKDVFASIHMTPMDKRRLMKFLQTALDHATAQQAAQELEAQQLEQQQDVVVQTLNERHLNQGRSLARPQNKAVQQEDMSLLQQCMHENMSLVDFLQAKQRLSPALAALVQYAMALDLASNRTSDTGSDHATSTTTTTTSLQEGMRHLSRHMLALGRFGTTAFLAPLYGSGELPQAFCRSAAVYGATYLLRRAVVGLVIVNDNDDASDDDKGRIEAVQLVSTDQGGMDPVEPMKRIRCSHVVVPSQALTSRTTSTTRRVLRRISILRGRPFQQGAGMQQQRHVVIVPPHTVGNESAIQGILLDDSVQVAPFVPGGCTVVHWTTVCEANASDDSVLERTLALFLEKCPRHEEAAAEELFGATFSYPLRTSPVAAATETTVPKGVHVIQRPAPGIAVDDAFEEAQRLFQEICPGQEFLALSQAMTETIQQTLGDQQQEQDDEELVLESAMGLIQKQQQEQQTATSEAGTSGSADATVGETSQEMGATAAASKEQNVETKGSP